MTEKAKALVENNHNLIYYYLNKRKMDIDEWYDILAIALCNAAISFDDSISNFSTYAMKCLNRAVCTELRVREYAKRKLNKEARSYDEKLTNDFHNKKDETVQSILPSHLNTEEEAITNITFLKCYNNLNGRDKKIISLLIEGYNMKEIGKILNITNEAVRLRKNKFRKLLKDAQM